jgi:hypothetical protein
VADAAKAEDDGALVLLEYLDGVEDIQQDDGDGDEIRRVVGHEVTAFRLDGVWQPQ